MDEDAGGEGAPPLTGIDEALAAFGDRLRPLPAADVALSEARGRVLAQDADAGIPLPAFTQSAMDGYALRAADTRDAGPGEPARLRLAGTSAAGGEDLPRVGPGRAARIYTGAPLPDGADAVLRQEDARVEDAELLVDRPVSEGTAVRRAGEEVAEGAGIAAAGERLTAGHLCALAAVGRDRVTVRRAPRVRLLVTGDEVVPAGAELRPGQVHDANEPLVSAWLASRGYDRPRREHVPDDLGATREALREALSAADLVVVSGGASVGDRDHVPEAAEAEGAERVFWRVRQKPGKPLYFGVRDAGDGPPTPVLGLPGNPGSVHACLVTHVRRALDVLEGAAEPGPRLAPGRLAESRTLDPHREWWLRCELGFGDDGTARLHPLPNQSSHMVTNLGRCSALARLPRGDGELEAGSRVEWVPAAGAGPW